MNDSIKYCITRKEKVMAKDALKQREHETIRNHVGFYNFTHELLEVTGSDADKFLDKMFVNTIAGCKIGRAKYTTMLNEEGIIIDDVIIFRLEEEKFWVSTLYIEEMIQWFDQHKENADVEYKEITEETSMFAIQGPKSKEFLNKLLEDSVDDLKYQEIRDNRIEDIPIKVARSGFTGELGYELYIVPACNDFIEEKLCQVGQDFNVDMITSDVILKSLPMEKGYILMSDVEGTNPIEAGFGWSVHWEKDFIGKEALEKVKDEGPKRSLIGFTIDDENAEIETGTKAMVNGEEAGKITNSTYGYTVGKTIGYVLIDNDAAKVGDKAEIAGHEALLTEREFYDPENKRVRG